MPSLVPRSSRGIITAYNCLAVKALGILDYAYRLVREGFILKSSDIERKRKRKTILIRQQFWWRLLPGSRFGRAWQKFPRIEACARIVKAPVPLILFLALPASALVSIVKIIGMRILFHDKPCQFHLPHNFDKSRYFLSRHFQGCGLFFSHLV